MKINNILYIQMSFLVALVKYQHTVTKTASFTRLLTDEEQCLQQDESCKRSSQRSFTVQIITEMQKPYNQFALISTINH
jgi:hypothetical protein